MCIRDRVSAELTDELHFLKALAVVGMFFQPKAGLRVLTLLRKEKVAPEATDTVVPVSYTHLALYMGVCSIFIANVFGVPLTFDQMMMIVLTGTLASIDVYKRQHTYIGPPAFRFRFFRSLNAAVFCFPCCWKKE